MEAGYAVDVEAVSKKMAQVKKKKPGFIKRWFAKMSREAWESEREYPPSVTDISINKIRGVQVGVPSIDQPERALQFTIYTANGGRIVETRRYDRKTDRSSNGLYIITAEQDFGREIDKIITMEALKG